MDTAATQEDLLVLNPDELSQDPTVGMDLAVSLGIGSLEMRTSGDANLLMLDDSRLEHIRAEADARGLRIAALAAPLWKWCRPEATPGRVDSFGFPTRMPVKDRARWVERALAVAAILGTTRVRIFSHLRVEAELTESLEHDHLLPWALERAEAAGVRLLLENEPVCTAHTPDRLLALLSLYPGLGLWLDLGNLHEVGAATEHTVGALAPFVEYVHIKDFRQHDGHRDFCPAGTGDVPYAPLLKVLHASRPGLPYGLETHVKDDPAGALCEGAGFLRRNGVGA
ncbi:sugar phosphate isomerase/epimerase family protein [Streptomyces sp. NPDC001404]|uniref:sugar phosphate isomerase/epimerase family protein n=1 Tax=Streptomyces sp. NPDC001404 TaxID=3364571 RepID=UPI0036915159